MILKILVFIQLFVDSCSCDALINFTLEKVSIVRVYSTFYSLTFPSQSVFSLMTFLGG